MSRRLLVIDADDGPWLDEAASHTHAGDEWAVLSLGASPGMLRRRLGSRLEQLGSAWFLPLDDLADRAHEAVAEFMVTQIPNLPDQDLDGTTLAAMLAAPEGNRWWYLETGEKSPFGRLVRWLYGLALVRLAVQAGRYDEVRLALGDVELRRAFARPPADFPPVRLAAGFASPGRLAADLALIVRYWRSAWLVLRSVIATRAVIAFAGWRVPDPPPAGTFCFTFYPYFWVDAFGAGATERFFSALPEGRPAQYLAWLSEPRELWRRRGSIASVLVSQRILPLQRYIGLRDMVAILSPWLFVRLLRFLARRRHLQARLLGLDVAGLVARDIACSLSAPQVFDNQLICRATRNFTRAVTASTMLYRVEFQAFEHAFLFGLRERATSVGFRHGTFGSNYLPMRFANGEMAEYLARAAPRRDMPLPDAFLVSGPLGAERLIADGVPPQRIAICGPQRHPALFKRVPTEEAPAKRRNSRAMAIYVAIPIVVADTKELLSELGNARREVDFRLRVKFHPSLPLGDAELRGLLADFGLGDCSDLVGPTVYEELRSSEAVVLVGSTLAFEAMALGVMPIVFENQATFGATSLAEFASALYVVRNSEGILTALQEIRDDAQAATGRRAHWPHALHRILYDLETPLGSQLTAALAALGPILGTHADPRIDRRPLQPDRQPFLVR